MNGYGRGRENSAKEKTSSIITRETIGMTLLLFSVALLVVCIIGSYLLGEIGVAITSFFLGVFGYFTYPLLLLSTGVSLRLITGKKFFAGKWVMLTMFVAVSAFLVAHLATSAACFGGNYGSYLSACWNAPATSATAGGVLLGLIVYPVQALLSTAGAYVALSLVVAASLFCFLWATPLRNRIKKTGAPRAKTVEKAVPKPAKPVRAEKSAPKEEPEERYQPEEPYGGYDRPAEPYGRETPPAEEPYGRYDRPAEPYGRYNPPADYGRYNPPADPYGRNRPAARGGAYTAPDMPDFDRYTPPTTASSPVDSMDILYGNDPASNYRNNLIYNSDSRFNTHKRRSSVEPDDSPVRANPREIPVDFERRTRERGYSESYSAQPPRPEMPRKVVEQRPQTVDLNYTQQPSYKAPDAPAGEPHGFYDVPYEEEFSSAPNVDDLPQPEEPPRTEPPRTERPELRRADPEPRPEPVKSEPRSAFVQSAEAPRGETVGESFRTPYTGAEGSSDRSLGRDEFSSDRSLGRDDFSSDRSLGRDDFSSDRSLGRDDFSSDRSLGRDDFSSDRSLGRDEFSSDRSLGRDDFSSDRSLGRDEFSSDRAYPPEEDAGRSRAIDGLPSRADMFDDEEDFDADLPAPMPRTRAPKEAAHPVPSTPAPQPVKHVYRPYVKPSVAILHQYDESVTVGQEEIEQNSQTIIDTLAGFRVDVEVMRVAVGPSVTRYDINIPHNISVNAVTKRDDDVAMRLHARDGVNMYSNNESGFISIEVPNKNRAIVGLRSLLQSEEYLRDKPGALTFAIGKDLEGRCVCGNIAKMKHILVAGATGSGKSVCLNAMLISLLCKYSPEELRIILIDPKKVEFAIYDGLPHLMINEIIADAQKAVMALNWAIKEMERRYELFEQKTRSGVVVRDLDEYNENRTEDEQKLPKIVIVVDELADLMSVAKKDIEERIQRLTQKARAAGIHLVIATQRPSVDVITGVIKGNLPTRMAFRVIQEVDSRTILDDTGAQKLLGNGDMLYRTEGMFNCLRVQGAFLSSAEVQAIIEEIKSNNEAYFDPAVADFINNIQSDGDDGDPDGGEEGSANSEYTRALAMVVKLGQASISLIQRKCSIGYNHAGKIIEWMESMHYISPFDGKAKARTVLLTKEEYESKYGPLD